MFFLLEAREEVHPGSLGKPAASGGFGGGNCLLAGFGHGGAKVIDTAPGAALFTAW